MSNPARAHRSPPRRGLTVATYATLISATAVWGTQFAVGKIAVTTVPPLSFAFARTLLAAVVFVAAALAFGGGLRVQWRDVPGLILVGAVGYALNQVALFLGLRFSPASDGALMGPTTNPGFTLLLAWLLGRESANRRQLAGMLVSAFGVALELVAVELEGSSSAAPYRFAGDLLFLFSGLAWAVMSGFGRDYMARYGSLRTTTWAFVIGTPVVGLSALLAGERVDVAALGPRDGLILVFMAVFGGFLAFWLFNRGVAHAGAGVASRFANLIPVFGLLVSVPVLGERPSPLQIVGAALIVAGVWVSTVDRGRRAAAPATRTDRAIAIPAAPQEPTS